MPTFNSTRQFGIEIEGTGLSVSQAAAALRNAGIPCEDNGYNHSVRPHWKAVSDASVGDGFEIVSPILSGVEGLEAVKAVAAALVAAGATVDRSCGLHVHVNARDLSSKSFANVARRYARFESEIDALHPRSRRNNSYCQSVNDIVDDITRLEANGYSTRELSQNIGSRYYKVNLVSFLRHGTVEFRQHAGTVDGTKMVNWIMFCVMFVEDSIIAPEVPATVTPAPVATVLPVVSQIATVPGAPAMRSNAIARKFLRLLELLQNSTRAQCLQPSYIAQQLEIAAASVPSYVSMFRVAYPTVTVNAVYGGQGYWSPNAAAFVTNATTPATAPVPAPVAAPAPVAPRIDRGIYGSLPMHVRTYFVERALELGN